MSAPACWGWKTCPERQWGPLVCRFSLEAQLRGRRPMFGDYHEAATLSKQDQQNSGRKCANYRAGML